MSIRILPPQVIIIGLLGMAIYAPIVSAERRPSPSYAESAPPEASMELSESGPRHQAIDAQKQPLTLTASGEKRTLPNLSPAEGWPSPVNDQENRLFTLIDVLDIAPKPVGPRRATAGTSRVVRRRLQPSLVQERGATGHGLQSGL